MPNRAPPDEALGAGGAVPIIRPDPYQQLLREIANLDARIVGRIEGIEKSIEVAHADLVRVPTAVDKAVETLRQLTWARLDTVDVKFQGITTQFVERDVRVEQTARDTKTAVDAAMAAQEKSAGKQADSFTKQIDALAVQIQQSIKATDDKINDIKERQTRIEGQGKGRSDVWGYLVGAVGLLLTLVSIFRGHV